MNTPKPFSWSRLSALAATALGFTLPVLAPTAVSAQNLVGVGQKPYVLVVQDTSASMEWGAEGDTYPCYNKEQGKSCAQSNVTTSGMPAGSAFEWVPAAGLITGGELKWNNSNNTCTEDQRQASDTYCVATRYANVNDGPEYIGPCMVWEPRCEDYSRPFWDGRLGYNTGVAGGDYAWRPGAQALLNNRFLKMRGNIGDTPIRLKNDNQPRHVMVKEVLTGEMVLKPNGAAAESDFNYDTHGPGCWFVPRMRDTPSARDATSLCRGTAAYEAMVDHQDPRPHLQEVFDYQLATGLMDNLSNSVIFAVAMFDGRPGRYAGADSPTPAYPVDHNYRGNQSDNWGLNDGIITQEASLQAKESQGNAGDGRTGNSYNLGIYRIVGPSNLDIPSSMLPGVSAIAQLALVDAGFIQTNKTPSMTLTFERGANDAQQEASRWTLAPGPADSPSFASTISQALSLSLPTGLERYMEAYELGKQPVAYGTPLAAVFADVHAFFTGAQGTMKVDGTSDTSANKLFSPIKDDPFKDCRAKHVVLITDGFPRPERANARNDLGSESLGGATEYKQDNQLYKYLPSEDEIGALLQSMNGSGNQVEPRYRTRAHIVAINALPAAGGPENDRRIKALRKLGDMARKGETCAYYYLITGDGKRFIPQNRVLTVPSGDYQGTYQGTCDPATDNCLVMEQDQSGYMFKLDDGVTQVECPAPALILEKNANAASNSNIQDTNLDNAGTDLTVALQLIFNKILETDSDIASRTRASVTSYLDAPDNIVGQYRIYSGSEVGGGLYWRGLLNRQELICGVDAKSGDKSGNLPIPMHVDIANQIQYTVGFNETAEDDGFRDNRRIFTSHADTTPDGNYKLLKFTNESTNTIFSTYSLDKGNTDEFGPTYVYGNTASVTDTATLTRIPLRPVQLLKAYADDLATPTLAAPNSIGDLIALFGKNINDTTSQTRAAMNTIMGVTTGLEMRRTISEVRGRRVEKLGRALGGILNSNPVTVGPPALDLPIDSYREFKARYAGRSTMLYVATLDGLLHAVHTGVGTNRVQRRALVDMNTNSTSESAGEVVSLAEDLRQIRTRPDYNPASPYSSQREAWAYAPQMLMRQYAANANRQPNLMDGTPVVADVRLCNAKTEFNFNEQACGGFNAGSSMPGYAQWRTVLVQGLGQSGPGYFALDVTRSGGLVDAEDGSTSAVRSPDPIALWEFDPNWEETQLKMLRDRDPAGFEKRANAQSSSITQTFNPTDAGCDALDEQTNYGFTSIAQMSFMGLSVGDPAVGTVAVSLGSGGASQVIRRAVAVFSAGISGPGTGGRSGCGVSRRVGKAIYVVDMQTGSLLRRFVSYYDTNNNEFAFPAEVMGSPALFDDTPGAVVTRGFVGDIQGRMFRVNMQDPNVSNWRVELMYDPAVDGSLNGKLTGKGFTNSPINYGPASYRPSLTLDDNRSLVVTYGLGERNDLSTAGQAQAVIALRELFKVDGSGNTGRLETQDKLVIWHRALEAREKLTGEPIVFNNDVYFTTYYQDDTANLCTPGTSRIYGLKLLGTGDPTNDAPRGALEVDTTQFGGGGAGNAAGGIFYEPDASAPSPGASTNVAYWIGPADPTLIRGVAVTLGPTCNDDTFNNPGGNGQQAFDQPAAKPQLIAQTGGSQPTSSSQFSRGGGAGTADSISRFVMDLKAPTSRFDMLSWTVISN